MSRSILSFSDSISRGTATTTETRSSLMVRMTSLGFSVSWKSTVPASNCGRNMPRNCPKTWLSGSRLRKRSGWKMRSYFRYPAIWRSSGSRFARMLPCVITTPRGSAVVPEVKTISTMSSRLA